MKNGLFLYRCTHVHLSPLQIIARPRCLAGISKDVDDIHKRKQLREHGIDGPHVAAGIFSGNSPFLSLSVVLISREIREAWGFALAAGGRIQNEREAHRR